MTADSRPAHLRPGDRATRNAPLRAATLADARAAHATPPRDARPMVRWWWFGPAQTEAMIDHDLASMAAAGVGGAELAVVYPMSLPERGEPEPYPYLSETFLDRVAHAADRAHDLDLRFDVTLGGGWSYGGPHIDRTLGAKRLRWQTVELAPTEPAVVLAPTAAGESLVAAYLAAGTLESLPRAWEMLDGVVPGHVLDLPAAPGPRVLALAWCTPTGQTVKRAPLGGAGYLLDHYSAAATRRHLEVVARPLLAAAQRSGADRVTAVFCDSLEVHTADWTETLPAEFARRRGYDLLPELPLLLRASRHRTDDERVRRLRTDLGRTLTDLYEASFVAPLRDLARERGVLLRLQGYGKPPAAMRSYAGVDLIEGESWGWDGFPPTRWASSAAHALGENVVSAETWTWVASPSLAATPLDLQAEAVEHLSLGVTQFVAHGWPSAPSELVDPGWPFYAAGALTDRNPWWPVMPELTTMLARLGALARLGEPVREVGVYVPDAAAYGRLTPAGDGLGADIDLWAATRDCVGPELLGTLRGAGYDVDVLDDAALATASRRHRVVVVGAPVPPGDPAHAVLRELAEAGCAVVGCAVVEVGGVSEVGGVLGEVRAVVPPAVVRTAPTLLPVQRRLADADLLLLANVGSGDVTGPVVPAARRAHWEVWEPRSGAMCPLPADGVVSVAAHAALVLVGHDGDASAVASAHPGSVAGVPADGVGLDVRWYSSSGEPVSFPALADWREGPDGVTLVADVEVPSVSAGVGAPLGADVGVEVGAECVRIALVVDLGEGAPGAGGGVPDRGTGPSYRAGYVPPVGTAVVIEVDGERRGALWAPPYRLEIEMSPGRHRVSVTAFGSAAGSLIGNEELVARQEVLTRRYGPLFALQDMDRVPESLVVGFCEAPRVSVVELS